MFHNSAAALARMVGSVAALATHPYDEWIQDVQDVQDAARGHVMAKPLIPDPFPFVPEVDYLDAPAPTNGHEHSPSPPTQTIDPKLLRLPSPPAPSKPEARSIVSEYIASADWLSADAEEPNVGDPGVPPCASLLADDGSSIFRCLIDQIKQQGITKYKCADCKHIADRIDRALEHQRSKLHYKPFSCPRGCQVKASSWEAIATHLKSSPHKAAVKCPKCPKFVSMRNLTRHLNTHAPKQDRKKPRGKRASAKRRL